MFKIFVGNLDYKVRPEQVRELFAIYAPIEDLVLPTDPKTNKPRGFAIVMIRDPELGAAAIRAVQGKRLMGRELVVNEAMKKKGKAEQASSPPPRTGPFGPRMFRPGGGQVGGDPRSRGNRNPRRSFGGTVTRPPQGARPQPSPGASPSPSGVVGERAVRHPSSAPPSSPGGPPPVKAEQGPGSDLPRSPAAKAKPKSAAPPGTPSAESRDS